MRGSTWYISSFRPKFECFISPEISCKSSLPDKTLPFMLIVFKYRGVQKMNTLLFVPLSKNSGNWQKKERKPRITWTYQEKVPMLPSQIEKSILCSSSHNSQNRSIHSVPTFSSENHFQTHYRTPNISIHWLLKVQFKQNGANLIQTILSQHQHSCYDQNYCAGKLFKWTVTSGDPKE